MNKNVYVFIVEFENEYGTDSQVFGVFSNKKKLAECIDLNINKSREFTITSDSLPDLKAISKKIKDLDRDDVIEVYKGMYDPHSQYDKTRSVSFWVHCLILNSIV